MSLLFEEFKTICFHLNRVGITPTLMGSLGLEFRTKENWGPSDIDIHVPGDPRGWEADIELIHIEGITFRLPSLEQYLSIYKASSQDSYRNEQNNNKDFKKIEWLEKHL